MEIWSKTWLLPFYPDKCKHLQLGWDNVEETRYDVCQITIQKMNEEKNLGVIMDKK